MAALSLVFGLAFLAILVLGLLQSSYGPGRGADNAEGPLLLPFLGVFMLVDSFLMVFPLAALFGRCSVFWKDGRLHVEEILGPLRWTRRLPPKAITRFEVSRLRFEGYKAKPQKEWFWICSLMAVHEDGRRKLVVWGYPQRLLMDLASELGRAAKVGAPALEAGPIPVADAVSEDPYLQDVWRQPTTSNIRLEQHADGVELHIQPRGLWRGSQGLAPVGIISLVLVIVIGVLCITDMLQKGSNPESDSGVLPVIGALGFMLVAVGFFTLSGLNMARQSATVRVSNKHLEVEVRGLFGTRRWIWPREELAAVRVGPSKVEVINERLPELQVVPLRGKKVGLFVGRDREELLWLATQLRSVLRVPATPEHPQESF